MSSVAGGRDPRGDALLRAFARDLAKMRRDLRNLEAANQISSASIEGGTLDVYDDDDVLRERIGKQANGSYGRLVLEGPVPPVPTEPDVQVIADGVVAITWDGRCEEKWPFVDFEAVRVHLVSDPVNEVCDRDNQVGAIFAHRGGTIVAVTESDDDNPVYARLVAVSAAGHTSDPSPAVLVDEDDEDDLEEPEDELEWEQDDYHVLTAADIASGTVTMSLSHDPEDESLTAVLAGAPQRPATYTIDYSGPTLTMPLSGWEEAGDVLWVHYPYRQPADGLSVPFGATGWSYKTIGIADATDYSAPSFDDSAWAVGAAAFGSDENGGHDYDQWGGYKTPWDVDSRIWLRRRFTQVTSANVAVRIDNYADVYWNGTLVASFTHDPGSIEDYNNPYAVQIPAQLITAGENVLAVRATDDGAFAGDKAVIDVRVIGTGTE